jgi:hypothetical protein
MSDTDEETKEPSAPPAPSVEQDYIPSTTATATSAYGSSKVVTPGISWNFFSSCFDRRTLDEVLQSEGFMSIDQISSGASPVLSGKNDISTANLLNDWKIRIFIRLVGTAKYEERDLQSTVKLESATMLFVKRRGDIWMRLENSPFMFKMTLNSEFTVYDNNTFAGRSLHRLRFLQPLDPSGCVRGYKANPIAVILLKVIFVPSGLECAAQGS